MTRESLSDRKSTAFTHVCLDCGQLGTAGGYHDHGYENAGDTIPLSALPAVLRSFQAIENERDELRAENERLRERVEKVAAAVERSMVTLVHGNCNVPGAKVGHSIFFEDNDWFDVQAAKDTLDANARPSSDETEVTE